MIDELAAVAVDLDAAADRLGSLVGVHRSAAQLIEQAAYPLIPKRTGRLAGSLATTVGEHGVEVTAGGPGVEYAWPIHQGVPGRGIAAHPFMSQAMTRTEADVVDLYLDHLDDVAELVT